MWQGQRTVLQLSLADRFDNLIYAQVADSLDTGAENFITVGERRINFLPF